MKSSGGPPTGSGTQPPAMWPSPGYPPPFLMMQQPPRAMDPSSRPFKPSSTVPRLDPNAPAFVPKTAHVLPPQPSSPAVVNAAARTNSSSGSAQVQVPTGPPPVSGTPNFVGSGKGFVPLCTAPPAATPAAASATPPTPAPVVAPTPVTVAEAVAKTTAAPAPKLQSTMSWAKRCSAANEILPEQPKMAAVAEAKREEKAVEAPTADPKHTKPQNSRKGSKRNEDPDSHHAKKGSRVSRRNREQTSKGEDTARVQEAPVAKPESAPVEKLEAASVAKPESAKPKVASVAKSEIAPPAQAAVAPAEKHEVLPAGKTSDASPAVKPVKALARTIGQWAQVARGAAPKQPEEPSRGIVATVTSSVAEAVHSIAHIVQPATPTEEAPTPLGQAPLKRGHKQKQQPDPSSRPAEHANQHKASRDGPSKASQKPDNSRTHTKEATPKATDDDGALLKSSVQHTEPEKEPPKPIVPESETALQPSDDKEEPSQQSPLSETISRAPEVDKSPAALAEEGELPAAVEAEEELLKPDDGEKPGVSLSKDAKAEVSHEEGEVLSSDVLPEVETKVEAAAEKAKSPWGANTPAAVLSATPSIDSKALPSVSGLSRAAKFGGSTRMSTIVSSLKTQQGRLAGLDEKTAPAEKAPSVVDIPPLEHRFEAVPTASGTLVYQMSDMMKIRNEPMCMAAMETHRFPEGIVEGHVATGFADGSRAQFGTHPINAMVDMGRGMGKSSTTGGFNIPPALRKGMSTDFAASESLWSTGGAKPRQSTQSTNTSFARSQTYADRPSNDREEWQRSGQRAIPSGGAAAAPLPEIPEDSWQIQQEKQKATGPRDVKVIRRLRAQLNKMTPKTYDDILKAILDIGIENMNEAQEFVNLIFDKAITNHGYIEMYADLCKDLGEELTARNLFPGKDKDGKDFRRLLLASCQQAFEKHLDQDFVAPEGISDEDRLELLLIHKEKMKGNLMFVACLGTRKLVVRRVLTMVMNNLLESSKSLQLEALASFLPLVIESLSEGKQATQFDQIFEKVEELSQDDKVEHRIQCLLKDTLDIRNAYLKTTQQNQILERSKSSRKGAWKAVMAESNRR